MRRDPRVLSILRELRWYGTPTGKRAHLAPEGREGGTACQLQPEQLTLHKASPAVSARHKQATLYCSRCVGAWVRAQQELELSKTKPRLELVA